MKQNNNKTLCTMVLQTTFEKLLSQEDRKSEHNQISDTDFFSWGVVGYIYTNF